MGGKLKLVANLVGVVLIVVAFGGWRAYNTWRRSQKSVSTATVTARTWTRTVEVWGMGEREVKSQEVPPATAIDPQRGTETYDEQYQTGWRVLKNRKTGAEISRSPTYGTRKATRSVWVYKVRDRHLLRSPTVTGNFEAPAWPEAKLTEDEAIEKKRETYTVTLSYDEVRTTTLTPATEAEFAKYTKGSPWKLEWNDIGETTVLGPGP